MIGFHQHLHANRATADAMLDQMAQEHWDNLSEKLPNGNGYLERSLPEYCATLRKKLKLKRTQKKLEIAPQDVQAIDDFFAWLTASDYEMLKKIIVCRPADFKAMRADIVAILPERIFYDGKQTPFGAKLVSDLFKYNPFRQSDYCLEFFADKLKIGESYCVYCNIGETDVVDDNPGPKAGRDLKAYLDVDHFLDQARNPFFALSFYNLVPSCVTCNRWVKKRAPFSLDTHVHPFHQAFDDLYRFVYLGPGKIDIIKHRKKPKDRTVKDLKILKRTAHRVKILENQLDWYVKYSRGGFSTTKEKEMFVEHFASFIPAKKQDMLKFSRGKLFRDVFEKIDEANRLLGL
ncbi:hypothetical protein IA69_31565 [Massilia sp. JS1662]|nr:hypothetical protein [Massilia sp. JS1662]KGF78228.1 hypothetical protein IA69_31565 [Massilia sp. JS1662]